MSVLLELTEGWQGMLGPFTLKLNGNPFPLTGYTVSLELRKGDGSLVPASGQIDVLDQVTNPGQVTYEPAAGDFILATGPNMSSIRQNFKLHWKVLDGDSKPVFFPHGAADEIVVHRA